MLLRADGKALLIDAGGPRNSRFDIGERLLAPALGRLGVTSLDAIVLTHNHPDHSGGVRYLLENMAVGEFWSNGDIESLDSELRRSLLENGTKIYSYDTEGWSFRKVGGLQRLSVFTAAGADLSENDQSLCLYLATDAGGVLLTGDLESYGVDAILAGPLPGAVTVLKAPHHGSSSSKPKTLINKLRPEIVVISAGYQNPYNFPAQELLDMAHEQGALVWRTDLDGTVRMRVEGDHWKTDHWQKGLFR